MSNTIDEIGIIVWRYAYSLLLFVSPAFDKLTFYIICTDNNDLEGSIPSEIANLKQIKEISLSKYFMWLLSVTSQIYI